MIVQYTRVALKALDRIPAEQARRIRAKIDQYAADPARLANVVRKLSGRPGYRMRVGDYRVIFDQDGTVMQILKIGSRGSVYED